MCGHCSQVEEVPHLREITHTYMEILQLIQRDGLFCMFSFSDIFAVLRILFYRKYLYNTYN